MRNVLFGFAGLLGLCSALWLLFALKGADGDVSNHSKKQPDYQLALVTENDDNASTELEQSRIYKLSGLAKGAKSFDGDNNKYCGGRCSSTLLMLDKDVELDDDTFRQLQAHAKEISAYFQNDDSTLQYFLEMALTTSDGDKRRFLTEIFTHLPYWQKSKLGRYYIESENWRVRADGVMLIADGAASNLDVAKTLMAVFSSEENAYVKGNILSYLNQRTTTLGDSEILSQLDSIIYNGIDSSVRVAALKAKMRISEYPYQMLTDAVQALRTNEPDFQFAGLIAIGQILEQENHHIQNGAFIDKASLKSDIDNVRYLAAYQDDGSRFDRLVKEANAIYSRHFEYF